MHQCSHIVSVHVARRSQWDHAVAGQFHRDSLEPTRTPRRCVELADAAIISACVFEPEVQSCLRLIACTEAPASCPEPPEVDRRTAQSLSDQRMPVPTSTWRIAYICDAVLVRLPHEDKAEQSGVEHVLGGAVHCPRQYTDGK